EPDTSRTRRGRLTDVTAADGTSYIVATTPTTEPAWTVAVSIGPDELAPPLLGMRARYLAFIGVLLFGALAVVLWFMRRDMRRLAAISRAAEAIGHGRFDVWLPPPTNDEIGRVTLALGSMVD